MTIRSAGATRTLCSLPPATGVYPGCVFQSCASRAGPTCAGGELERAVAANSGVCGLPLSLTLPHRGGGNGGSIARFVLLAAALLTVSGVTALAQSRDDGLATAVLRASVTVTSDVVRIGDVIDNAGTSAQIAIYRAPDLGTTGSLPTAQLLAALQAHQVIGVDTRDIKAISVTRLSRAIESKDIEFQVARALEHRGGLGDAANLTLTFDRDVQDLQLDTSNTGALQPVAARFEPRSGRFDVSFEIGNDSGNTPTRLRFTGSAIETVEAAVLTRNVERNEVLKSSDIVTERRPKAEVGADVAARDRAVGMQMRKQVRSGQALKTADLAKPDLVQRDQNVTLIYETAGLYLTVGGKALEGGAQGDVVNVLNLQSKRTVSGVVVGRNQVAIAVATPRLAAAADASSALGAAEPAAPVAVTASNSQASSQVSPKAE
jgi:flagellar basal body P-ring formation protein FlgA